MMKNDFGVENVITSKYLIANVTVMNLFSHADSCAIDLPFIQSYIPPVAA